MMTQLSCGLIQSCCYFPEKLDKLSVKGLWGERLGSDCQLLAGPLVTMETQASGSPPHLFPSSLASLGQELSR